jgi:hypothetical protein
VREVRQRGRAPRGDRDDGRLARGPVRREGEQDDRQGPTDGRGKRAQDKATGKTTNYQEWTLDSYIKVGCELKWITESAKDVADKLKEYCNFVHPAKELRYGVTLGFSDSSMFWQVTKALARQLLLSAPAP